MATCRAEIASLCQNIEAGRGRRLNCLIEHKAELGAECVAAVEMRQARMDACRTDMATLCQDVERGGGKRIACLKQNQPKLSAACAAALVNTAN